MTAAIFGLLGVFVGGVLQMFAEARRSTRTARTRARAGARLMRHELLVLDGALEVFGALGPVGAELAQEIVQPDLNPVLDLWTEYRPDLVGIPDWKKLTSGMSPLSARVHMPAGYEPPPDQATMLRDAIRDAREALQHPADPPGWWAINRRRGWGR